MSRIDREKRGSEKNKKSIRKNIDQTWHTNLIWGAYALTGAIGVSTVILLGVDLLTLPSSPPGNSQPGDHTLSPSTHHKEHHHHSGKKNTPGHLNVCHKKTLAEFQCGKVKVIINRNYFGDAVSATYLEQGSIDQYNTNLNYGANRKNEFGKVFVIKRKEVNHGNRPDKVLVYQKA